MRPLSIKLQGFKGISSGIGKEEIEINLSDLHGLVAVTGPNGAGKTTILDNMHPFRIMPYRAGGYSSKAFSYYSECYENSVKEFIFQIGHTIYKSLIMIDGRRKKQEAYLYEKNEENWLPLCDGKVDNYDKTVCSLVGASQLFFTTVFRCQDAVKLSDYTKGDIKDIFIELLGIDSFKLKGQRAKEIRAFLLQQLEMIQRQVENLKAIIVESEKAKTEAGETELKLSAIKSQTEEIEKALDRKSTALQTLKSELAVYEAAVKEKKSLQLKASEIQMRCVRLKEVIVKAKEIRTAVESEKSYLTECEKLKLSYTETDKAVNTLQRELNTLREVETQLATKERMLSEIRVKRESQQKALKNDLRKAKHTSELLHKVPCGDELHGKCELLKNAVTAGESIPKLIKEVHLSGKVTEAEKGLAKEITELMKGRSNTDIRQQLENTLKHKQELSNLIAECEKVLLRQRELSKRLPELELAEKTLPECEKELAEINGRLAKIKTNGDLNQRIQSASKEIATLKSRQKSIVQEESELRKHLGAKEALMKQGVTASAEMVTVTEKVETLKREISEWSILEKALGNDGITALEIDDAGPAISVITNELLNSCFGSRFSVRIDTQAVKANNKGLKETFDIVVLDSERDESKSLKKMSGGEKTWIEDAITKAISLFNASKSGISYEALFTDEKDGALDANRKKEFIAMKKKVLDIGKYDVEFFISQSPELHELADHKIEIGQTVTIS